jgi:hypothetical protein
MSLSIRFDPHRAKRLLRISKISNLERETALVRSSSPMSICAFCRESVRVARPHAMLQIVLFAIVISELMPSSWPAIIVACEPRSSNRTFLPVL